MAINSMKTLELAIGLAPSRHFDGQIALMIVFCWLCVFLIMGVTMRR